MSSGNGSTISKKRKGDGGCAPSPREGSDGVMQELSTLKSMVRQLLNHSNSQSSKMERMEENIQYLKSRSAHLEESLAKTHKLLRISTDDSREKIANADARLDRIEKRQKYHKELLGNQKWTYSAPPPPESYWQSIEGEEYYDSAKDFLDQIQRVTNDMRYGVCDGNISIAVDVLVPFDPVFMSHWEEFTDALNQYQHAHTRCFLMEGQTTSLELRGVELPEDVVDLLSGSGSLRDTYFHQLEWSNNGFTRNGIEWALEYVQRNNMLIVVALDWNNLSNDRARQVSEIIKYHPNICTLNLDGCSVDEGWQWSQPIMHSGKNKLKFLNLANNGICAEGRTFISDFLANNTVLYSLNLYNNRLGDEDFVKISGALKRNKMLRLLRLGLNEATTAGWRALCRAVFDKTSPNSAAESNHTCSIDFPFTDGIRKSILGMNCAPGLDVFPDDDEDEKMRWKKIYYVLCVGNRNRTNSLHLDDSPLTILPDVLNSVQRYSRYRYHFPACPDEVEPLSVVYEIIRWWDKSFPLYESYRRQKNKCAPEPLGS